MFDTHCHLNFKALWKNVEQVIEDARRVGVDQLIVPGTDWETSSRAVTIAEKHDGVYAAVGIHPHHAKEFRVQNLELRIKKNNIVGVKRDLSNPDVGAKFIKLISHPKVVAVGEVGLDYHSYQNTKYQSYKIDNDFIDRQKKLLIKQIQLAIKYDKSLILHNREAKQDLLPLLVKNWDKKLEGKAVFHCCEPDLELLDFAQKHNIFIGVDGDVTYSKEKAEFVKKVPLDLLVLETDSPYLLPEPLRSAKQYPNVPSNVALIARFLSKQLGIDEAIIEKQTTNNAISLFNLPLN